VATSAIWIPFPPDSRWPELPGAPGCAVRETVAGSVRGTIARSVLGNTGITILHPACRASTMQSQSTDSARPSTRASDPAGRTHIVPHDRPDHRPLTWAPQNSPLTRPSSPTRFAPLGCLCTGRDGPRLGTWFASRVAAGAEEGSPPPGRNAETPWSLAIAKADARASRPRDDGSAGAPNPGTSWEASSEMKEAKRDRRARDE
jgi:hypothetical protein